MTLTRHFIIDLKILTMLKRLLVFMGLWAFLSLSGCEQSPDSKQTTETSDPPSIILAVLPYDLPTNVQTHFEPFLQYLSQVTHQQVKLYIATSYEDQIQKVLSQQVDLAYMGATIYVKTQKVLTQSQLPPLKPIATEAPYKAAVVVHQESTLTNLSDLKNHRVAFGSYFSYTGHFAIRNELKKAGVRLADLSFYSFLKRHHRSILSVVHHQFDAAATPLGIAKRMIEQGYPIKILHTTETLAPIVLATTAKFPTQIAQQIQTALLTPDFNQQIQLSLIKPEGFIQFDDAPYQKVSEILNLFEQ